MPVLWWSLVSEAVCNGENLLCSYGPCITMLSTSRLWSKEKRFAVLMVWSLFVFACLLLVFWFWKKFLAGTNVHSVEFIGLLDASGWTRTFPRVLFVGGYIDSSFCRVSMIFRADPSSFNTSHSCDSYSLHLFTVWLVDISCGFRQDVGEAIAVNDTVRHDEHVFGCLIPN